MHRILRWQICRPEGTFPISLQPGLSDRGMRFTNGDTLIERITPCLENGKTAYVDFLREKEIAWGSTEYIVMKSRSPLPDEFSYFLARSTRFREFAIRNMSGTSGRQRVTVSALSNFALPSPPPQLTAEFGRTVRTILSRAQQSYPGIPQACRNAGHTAAEANQWKDAGNATGRTST